LTGGLLTLKSVKAEAANTAAVKEKVNMEGVAKADTMKVARINT
jgi:hypothetical protein